MKVCVIYIQLKDQLNTLLEDKQNLIDENTLLHNQNTQLETQITTLTNNPLDRSLSAELRLNNMTDADNIQAGLAADLNTTFQLFASENAINSLNLFSGQDPAYLVNAFLSDAERIARQRN